MKRETTLRHLGWTAFLVVASGMVACGGDPAVGEWEAQEATGGMRHTLTISAHPQEQGRLSVKMSYFLRKMDGDVDRVEYEGMMIAGSFVQLAQRRTCIGNACIERRHRDPDALMWCKYVHSLDAFECTFERQGSSEPDADISWGRRF